MFKRIRSFVESIVFAGMKPSGPVAPGTPQGKPGFLERFLSSPASSDPFYLTNQTFGQKLRRFSLTAAPMLLVLGLLAGGLMFFRPKVSGEAKEMTTAERAAKILPGFEKKEFKLDTNKDIEVMEMSCNSPVMGQLTGTVRNNSGGLLAEVVVVLDLLDADGSQLGGITITEKNLAPGTSRNFQKAIDQTTAVQAVVRNVRTQ